MKRWPKCKSWVAPLATIGVLAAGVLLAPALARSAEEGARVIAVDVRGTNTIAKETILAKVQMKAGAPYQNDVVSEDIRRLFAMGYFTDVKADVEQLPEGLKLTFVVKEKPVIERIAFDGHRHVQTARLLQLSALAKGQLYDPRKVKEGVDLIKAEYARKGFSEVEIASSAEADEATNAVVVHFLIDEGSRLRIAGILVEGNEAFPDRRLLKVMKTKRRKWLMAATYDEQVLAEDLERIRAFYRKNGYQDAEVTDEVLRDPKGKGLYLHMKISEGLQHRIGAVTLTGAVLFPERELRRMIGLKPGAVYNTEAVQEDLRRIKEYYGDRGYINVEIAPEPQLDAATKRVNLTYRITEHELVYVNKITVEGNLQTQDVVARREMRIDPGARFDGAKIRKSIERLYNLGFFEEVNVDTQPTKQPDRQDLVVRVKEAKSGSFSFGGGFSSVDRLVGLVELEQRNFDWRNAPKFTGAGQDVRMAVEIGSVRRYFDFSFTEPWAFGRPVSLGFDLFNRTRLRSRNLGLAFEEQKRGLGLRLGKEFNDRIKVSLGYQLFRTEISSVVDEASADLKAEQGRTNVSEGSLQVGLDTRNNRFDPTQGYNVYSGVDLAGGVFGADRDFYRLQGGASNFWPHAGRCVFESSLRAGIVDAYSNTDDVPIFERFFGGGAGTIRGYQERKVGPRDPSSNDPIGGESTLSGTAEEVLTIIKDERSRPILKGSVFYDVGNVWRRVSDFGSSLKSGVGVGTRITTPIGPVRLDLGFPISNLQGEKRKPRFHFNVSRSF